MRMSWEGETRGATAPLTHFGNHTNTGTTVSDHLFRPLIMVHVAVCLQDVSIKDTSVEIKHIGLFSNHTHDDKNL